MEYILYSVSRQRCWNTLERVEDIVTAEATRVEGENSI